MNFDFSHLMRHNEVAILCAAIGLFVFFWGLIGLFIGVSRGRGFAGFVWGLILGPFGCLIACHLPDSNRGRQERLLEALIGEMRTCGQRLSALEGAVKSVERTVGSDEEAALLREHNARYIKTMQYVCDRLADMCDHLGVKEATLNGEKMDEAPAPAVGTQTSVETPLTGPSVAAKPIELKLALQKDPPPLRQSSESEGVPA